MTETGPDGSNWVTNRKKRRIPCQLWVGEREHSALILDLSPSGLFVQTHAKPQRGERVGLGINEAKPAFELEREPGLRFRVYVAQIGGPRSRRVEVAAPDAAAAGVR